jgi:hypothetical protein
MPTRIQIQQQEQSADGSIVTKDIVMDVYFIDTSSEVIQTFNKATTLIQEGKNQEGMELI